MSTIQDFENAPIGATATSTDGRKMCRRETKTPAGLDWVREEGDTSIWADADDLAYYGYTLGPALTAPTSAREALDLAWDLGHEVKEGQVIPKGTQYLEVTGSGLKEYIAQIDFEISYHLVPGVRTFDPIPDPEPDWLNARAVLARHVKYAPDSRPSLWVNLGDGMWGHAETTKRATVWNLRDVTPLYPKEQDA